jgi:hypothetical protein
VRFVVTLLYVGTEPQVRPSARRHARKAGNAAKSRERIAGPPPPSVAGGHTCTPSSTTPTVRPWPPCYVALRRHHGSTFIVQLAADGTVVHYPLSRMARAPARLPFPFGHQPVEGRAVHRVPESREGGPTEQDRPRYHHAYPEGIVVNAGGLSLCKSSSCRRAWEPAVDGSRAIR